MSRTSPLRIDPRNMNQEIDNLFNVPIVIDVAHHELHEGDTFSMIASDTAAATTDTVQLYIKTAAVTSPQKRHHLLLSHYGSGEHSVVITEGVTFTTGGAAFTPINRRRDSASTTASQAVRVGGDNLTGDVLQYTGGAAIWTELIGTGRGSGGVSRGTEEWILDADTGYIFEIIAVAAGGIAINISATWYEHTDSLR